MVTTQRALVVVTASLVGNPQAVSELTSRFPEYDVHQQLAERLDKRAIVLQHKKFDLVYFPDTEPRIFLEQHSIDAIADAMKPGAHLAGAIDEKLASNLLLAGLVKDSTSSTPKWRKPTEHEKMPMSVPLRRPEGAKSQLKSKFKITRAPDSTNLSTVGKSSNTQAFTLLPHASIPSEVVPKNLALDTPSSEGEDAPALSASALSFDPDSDDLDIIDEDDLLLDVKPAISLPPACDPSVTGRKRRKACKDCTCGLKELESDAVERQRELQRSVVTLTADEVAEIDFTVPGKAVGGCGSCSLGDAFRCDGCPYLGLPPFKPGQVVSVDNFGDDF